MRQAAPYSRYIIVEDTVFYYNRSDGHIYQILLNSSEKPTKVTDSKIRGFFTYHNGYLYTYSFVQNGGKENKRLESIRSNLPPRQPKPPEHKAQRSPLPRLSSTILKRNLIHIQSTKPLTSLLGGNYIYPVKALIPNICRPELGNTGTNVIGRKVMEYVFLTEEIMI